MRSAERAYFPFQQCATQPVEASVLGWEWTLGLCQAPGEGPVPLAGSGKRRSENRSQSGGTEPAAGRHRSGADQTARVASREPCGCIKTDQTKSSKYVLIDPSIRYSEEVPVSPSPSTPRPSEAEQI